MAKVWENVELLRERERGGGAILPELQIALHLPQNERWKNSLRGGRQ